ncbi:GNAT family N-acetyltransferase [Streptomyces sp. SID5785]|uniref:GNAT family N-acetyltransferase n=1 Tax=Streptomyces sp. SID5785 TaxID=2690309 RepID=UPI001360C6B1|nr:GNAT family N-acetyltransferase [Streptomyces sp. SID5785]
MTDLVIRPFEDGDIAGASAALIEVHATDGYPVEGVEDPKAWLTSDDVLAAWVAAEEGRVVGHVSVMKPRGEEAVVFWQKQSGDSQEGIGVLARLFVVRDARKRAAGERLMRAAMDYGQREGRRLVLDVVSKDVAAMRLYERLGWRKIGEAVHPYGDGQTIDAVCFVSPDSEAR